MSTHSRNFSIEYAAQKHPKQAINALNFPENPVAAYITKKYPVERLRKKFEESLSKILFFISSVLARLMFETR